MNVHYACICICICIYVWLHVSTHAHTHITWTSCVDSGTSHVRDIGGDIKTLQRLCAQAWRLSTCAYIRGYSFKSWLCSWASCQRRTDDDAYYALASMTFMCPERLDGYPAVWRPMPMILQILCATDLRKPSAHASSMPSCYTFDTSVEKST
jgi:hypothetical protein